MTTTTFNMRAGDRHATGAEDPAMQLHGQIIGTDIRTVRLPPDLGGRTVNVLEHRPMECLMRGCQDHTHLLVLDAPAPGGGHIGVVELACVGSFHWVRVEG